MSATSHAIPEPAGVSVPMFMGSLRASLGLPPNEPHPEEDAATLGRALPDVVEDLDPGAWLAWAQAGLLLFSGGTIPSVRNATSAGRRVALALAMRRTAGNISASAKALQTSRKVMREQLRAEGLYPWARRRIRPWMSTS
jgi:hypothetical protein